jgi:hypothetical protein
LTPGAVVQAGAGKAPDAPLSVRAAIRWIELVNDDTRARFHFDCAPMWRAQQEVAARKAMGLNQKETSL